MRLTWAIASTAAGPIENQALEAWISSLLGVGACGTSSPAGAPRGGTRPDRDRDERRRHCEQKRDERKLRGGAVNPSGVSKRTLADSARTSRQTIAGSERERVRRIDRPKRAATAAINASRRRHSAESRLATPSAAEADGVARCPRAAPALRGSARSTCRHRIGLARASLDPLSRAAQTDIRLIRASTRSPWLSPLRRRADDHELSIS